MSAPDEISAIAPNPFAEDVVGERFVTFRGSIEIEDKRGRERAAIIYAFTWAPGRGGQPNVSKTSNEALL